MDDKKKIVLGSEDFLAKGNEDIFINISLQQTFNQIKRDKYDNNFDLAEQFRKERNKSRSFRVYGIIESTIIDTDNLPLQVYKDSGLTQFHSIINSTPLVYDEKNVFNKKRGKYLLELNDYDANSVYIRINGDNVVYADQVIEQKLVFYTLDGDYVEYGTETIDIGLNNPGFLSIENDFPFFYNKHWVKNDLEIVETKPTVTQFGTESSIVQEGQSVTIEVVMDKPSPFGNESVVLDAVLGTVIPGDFNLSYNGSIVSFPVQMSWNQGEQNKTFTFDAIEDNINEFSEDLRFELSNFQFTTSGLTIAHYATIEDFSIRKKTNFHFGEVYRNRAFFSGRLVQYSPGGTPFNVEGFSILRNGLEYDNKEESFYPGDTFDINVINSGIDTILPINPTFGVNVEQAWPAGALKTFSIDTSYTGIEKHKVRMAFPPSGGLGVATGNIYINGVRINMSLVLSYYNLKNRFIYNNPTSSLTAQGMEQDWTVEEDDNTFVFTSKSTGIPVDIEIIPQGAGANSAMPYIVEIDPFVKREQVERVLTLHANTASGNICLYEFFTSKGGYKGVEVPLAPVLASELGEDRYLVTRVKDVAFNWDEATDDCIYDTTVLPVIGYPTTFLNNGDLHPGVNGVPNYYWTIGDVYINGTVFLSKNSLPGTKTNLTDFNFSSFQLSPIYTEPCTHLDIIQGSVKQKVELTFPTFGSASWCYTSRIPYQTNLVSFDYRNNESGPYTTFSKLGILNGQNIAWGNTVNTSPSTPLGTLKEHLDVGSGTLPVGPLDGSQTGNILTLEAKVAGVPFEIINVVPNSYDTEYPGTSFPDPTCSPISAGTITYTIGVQVITPNAISGATGNLANNWMGGYNTSLIYSPGGNTGGPGTTLPPSPTNPPASN